MKQQLGFLAIGAIPGILAFFKLVTPVQAGFFVMLLYIFSRRHANEVQKRFEKKKSAEEEAVREEAEKFARLPSKKRKAILKARAREQANQQEDNGEGDE